MYGIMYTARLVWMTNYSCRLLILILLLVANNYIGYSVMGVSNCWTEIWNEAVE